MRNQKNLLCAGLLLSPMAWAHEGHDLFLSHVWLSALLHPGPGLEHILAHALAAPALLFAAFAGGAAASGWLLCLLRPRGGRRQALRQGQWWIGLGGVLSAAATGLVYGM